MGPHVETKESAAPALLVLSTESSLARITLCGVDTPSDGMTAHLTRATWGARCGKSARRVLRGGTGTSDLVARLVPTHHNIDHHRLMERVRARVTDGKLTRLIAQFLKAEVLSDGFLLPTDKGTPQGGVISPLLANIALGIIEERYERWTHHRRKIQARRKSDAITAAMWARMTDRKA